MKSSDKGLFPSDTRRLREERPSLREPLVVAHSPHPSTDEKNVRHWQDMNKVFYSAYHILILTFLYVKRTV